MSVFAIMRQLIISTIVSDFSLTVLPRAFREKAGRCQGDKVILGSGAGRGLTKVKAVHARGSNARLPRPNQRCPVPAYRQAAA